MQGRGKDHVENPLTHGGGAPRVGDARRRVGWQKALAVPKQMHNALSNGDAETNPGHGDGVL